MMAKTTEYVLLDLGDLSAPKDSESYVKAAYEKARSSLNDTTNDRDDLRFWIAELRDSNRYHYLVDRQGRNFMLWEHFCTAPQPFGLGYDPEDIEYIIAEREKTAQQRAIEAKPLETHGGDRKSETYQEENQDRSSILIEKRDANYLTSRIKQEHPDIYERMVSGEYSSVRAAAIDAGLVKRYWQLPRDVKGAVKSIKAHFTAEQRRQIGQMLLEMEDE